MVSKKENISIGQAMIFLLTITYSPSMKVIPGYTVRMASQAAWLSPIISFGFLIVLVFMFHKIFNSLQNKNKSLMELICDVFGKVVGKIVIFIYILFITLLIVFYLRYLYETLLSTFFPDIDSSIIGIVMLTLVAIGLSYGLAVIARMCEIIFPFLLIAFSLLTVFLLPQFNFSNLTPVSYIDIIPIAKASTGVTSILSYFTLLFFFNDKINNAEKIKKAGIQAATFFVIILPITIITCLSVFGSTVVHRLSYPYLSVIQHIALFNTIERIEAVFIILRVCSDYIFIAVFSFIVLHMIKWFFNLKEFLPIKNIYLIFIYILSFLIARNEFELEELTDKIILPFQLIIGVLIPTLIFIVGKVRKKV